MALKVASDSLLVEPSLVNNDETERPSGLVVVTNSNPSRRVYRGVVRSVGHHVESAVYSGCVAHYVDYVEIDGLHVVPEHHLVAWEDDE